ncbi:Hypothetical Protein FCC1311_060922 [Hondaea fermentalgiana]|uniref:CFA20 domain-containing protein n=1 Tax=Hondaea fermentalgiana TaxID=2315210 RepID=A0A2R5GG34_9STRA|nr:Hypothetical Protein FCC1311_060922 [Hondaea fermentalgiana]|eukprot:GBG29872.1 Hypothetical Protein FCC1311_060922 [Hondaea fermentalgiana]
MLVGSFAMFACFFAVLLSVLIPNSRMFMKRHARRHRIAALMYLVWLLFGFTDLYLDVGINQFVFHVVLGCLGVAVTLSAAFDFRFHERVRNRASGTLEKETTVTFSEMIEHSFYQALNLVQISYLHLVSLSPRPAWQNMGLLMCATAPWLLRSHFPVNSFSKNYASVPLSSYSPELILYRIKKWQYVFYKHALLHGVNISAALRAGSSGLSLVDEPLFRLYWLSLNCSYVMEFFLQTLVKKRYMSQSVLLTLQRLLMAVSSVSALFVLLYVRLDVCLISFGLNMVNRGHDFVNTAIVLVLALALDPVWSAIFPYMSTAAGTRFQGGPSCEIFSPQGTDPLRKQGVGVHGRVGLEFDKSIKSYALVCNGGTTCKVDFPGAKAKRKNLALTQRYLAIQLSLPAAADPFGLELTVADAQRTRRRLVISSAFRNIVAHPLHVQLPLGAAYEPHFGDRDIDAERADDDTVVPRGIWLTLCLDMQELVASNFSGINFRALEALSISGTSKEQEEEADIALNEYAANSPSSPAAAISRAQVTQGDAAIDSDGDGELGEEDRPRGQSVETDATSLDNDDLADDDGYQTRTDDDEGNNLSRYTRAPTDADADSSHGGDALSDNDEIFLDGGNDEIGVDDPDASREEDDDLELSAALEPTSTARENRLRDRLVQEREELAQMEARIAAEEDRLLDARRREREADDDSVADLSEHERIAGKESTEERDDLAALSEQVLQTTISDALQNLASSSEDSTNGQRTASIDCASKNNAGNEKEEEEGDLDLVFDPILECYFCPKTNKYYKMK